MRWKIRESSGVKSRYFFYKKIQKSIDIKQGWCYNKVEVEGMEAETMKKLQYAWSSNKFDTIHTLRVYEGSKVIARMEKIDGETLRAAISELRAAGYTHKA